MRWVIVIGMVLLHASFAIAQVPEFKVLAFYDLKAERDHLAFAHAARAWLERIADERNFTVDLTTDRTNLNDRFLRNYQVVMWLTEMPLADEQRRSFEKFIEGGGHWIGFHRSIDPGTKPWPWFSSWIGVGAPVRRSSPPVPIRLVPQVQQHEIINNLPTSLAAPPNEWLQWSSQSPATEVILAVDPNEIPFGMSEVITSGTVQVVWTNARHNFVYFNLGHDGGTLSDYWINRMIEQAIVWMGGGQSKPEVWKSSPSQWPEMVRVEGGSFIMGDDRGEKDEQPAHQVTVSSFSMGKTEVTRAQWRMYCMATGRSMPERAWFAQDEDHPVVNVSWDQAIGYCAWLSEQTGKKFRLPTEAEWEFAARGGTKSKGYLYSGSNDADSAGFVGRRTEGTQPVARKKANELGLYDMTGNVWEWCSDWYEAGYYKHAPGQDPKGPDHGKFFTFRGGAWDIGARNGRVAYRNPLAPTSRNHNKGFRVVSEP